MDVLERWPIGLVDLFADYQGAYIRRQNRRAAKQRAKRR